MSLLAISDLSAEQIQFYLDTSRAFKKYIDSNSQQGEPIVPILKGKTIVNLFFEHSTRTRLSFELATRQLGGSVLNFASTSSSLQKGETLIDTARNIMAMKAHCFVIRHASAGTPQYLAQETGLPVVNAGDGFHEHPTQALLDALTMIEHLGSLKGKRVVILGDIAHSRVARSNIHLLTKLGASVAVCAPPTLLPPRPETLGVDFAYRPEDVLPAADVVMALRVQLERQNKMQLPSIQEYARFWGLNRERAKLLKPTTIIMHPGPVNRGVELDTEVADGPNSVILNQVKNGVIVRMAVLAAACDLKNLQTWLKIASPLTTGDKGILS